MEKNLTKGGVFRTLLGFSLPFLLSYFLQTLYGMADQMPKLRSLREMLRAENPGCLLQVDGGVDAHTCGICKENGAQVLVAGSAYFRAQDRAAFVRLIQAESYE